MPLIEEKVAAGFKAASEKINEIENVQDEFKQNLDELIKELRRLGKARLTSQFEGKRYNKFWEQEDDARQFGEIILGVLGRKALGEGTMVGGGALVPEELRAQIIDKLAQYGKFRGNCTVIPLGSDRQLVPKIETDLTIYCPDEGGTITDSDVSFSQVNLTMRTWAALAKVSNQLDEDSVIGIGEIVGISIARSMAKKEDEVGFIGDGTSTYFGMTGICGALLNVDPVIANIKGLKVATGNNYSEITLADFRGVIAILPAEIDDTAKWYMHKKFYYEVVYPLAETAGVANIFEILSDRKGRYLMGYEVQFVHCMPYAEANSQICAILGDLQLGAYLGQRRELRIEQSTDVFFANNQIAIRGVQRIDINAFGVGDTTDAGPIVGLITAAA